MKPVSEPSIFHELLAPLPLPKGLKQFIMQTLGINQLEQIYQVARIGNESSNQAGDFCEQSLKALSSATDFSSPALQSLQNVKGPLIFVANHPFGGVDALALMLLMHRVRGDFRFVANDLLKALPELHSILIPIDISDHSTRQRNFKAWKNAHRYLKSGGALGLFPSGEVDARKSLLHSNLTQKPWASSLAKLALATRSTVIPCYFAGQNGLLFQWVGLLFPRLRIALLAREMIHYRRTVELRVGRPIGPEELSGFLHPAHAIAFLQTEVNRLSESQKSVACDIPDAVCN